MSYSIRLSDEQFSILQDLINEGMEVILSPYDGAIVEGETEFHIRKVLSAVAFFNSHTPDILED